MQYLFFDTSALVKRYHDETGSDVVDALFEGDSVVVITSITAIETVSAFRRNYNRDELSASEMGDLASSFFREAVSDFLVVGVQESLFEFSFDLVLDDDLRTLDALQLSAAFSMPSPVAGVTIVSADEELVSAAKARGVGVIRPDADGGYVGDSPARS
jgi:predicted nucleic acid-binding protein